MKRILLITVLLLVGFGETDAGGQLPNPQCSDGIDNDGDGLVDFPADPDCTDALDDSEADLPQCSDGIDNDNDGLIDFPADPSCTDALDDSEADIPVMLPTVWESGLVTLIMILAAFGAFAIYHYPQRKVTAHRYSR